jgi:purine-binding chemotaxis protein CheW
LSDTDQLQQAFQPLPRRRDTGQSPLERILEGRAEAGCDEVQQDDTYDQVTPAETDFEEFLCIRVSDETYGIAIMQIKEIITPRLVTEVPRVPAFVRGVISLRGIIIPVIDLVARLGLSPAASTGRERVVVVKSGADDSFTGLLVDQVTHVARVASSRIEDAPATLDEIDRNFVRGMGRADNHLIPLLNIEGIADIQLS